LKLQTTDYIADVCGAGISCIASGSIAVTVHSKGYYVPPIDLQIPLAVDPERFPTVASVLSEVQPQFEKVCETQLFPSPELWGAFNCSQELQRQTLAWLRGNCNMNVGYPWQEAHGSNLAPEGGACDLAIVSAYVRIPGYSRRSREEYLQNALSALPSLLTAGGVHEYSHRTCAIMFSDDEDFLNAVSFSYLSLTP
jgi:hypothetical protein